MTRSKTAIYLGLVGSAVLATGVTLHCVTKREENTTPPDEPCALKNPFTGQFWVFCDLDCLAELTSAVMPDAPTRRWIRPVPDTGTCLHCGWCGTLVQQPERCALHDEACPADRWDLTLQGLAATASIAGHLPDFMTDAILAALEHVGRRHPEIDGRDLLRWVLDH